MNKLLSILIVCALLLGITGTSSQAQEAPVDQRVGVQAVYAAVEAGDVDAAVELLADDAVLVLIPPPPGMTGVFIGKEEIRDWYEGLVADHSRYEWGEVEVSGNREIFKAKNWDDFFENLGVASMEFEGVSVVQDGKVQSMTWVFTEESRARLDAAMARENNAQLVRRILQEIWSEGNLDLVDELVAEDYVSHTWPVGEGRDHFRQDVLSWRDDFPGATIVVDRIVFDDNRAIIFDHYVGPDGSLDEPLPEGEIPGVLIYQIENGQLSDRWYFAPFEPPEE